MQSNPILRYNLIDFDARSLRIPSRYSRLSLIPVIEAISILTVLFVLRGSAAPSLGPGPALISASRGCCEESISIVREHRDAFEETRRSQKSVPKGVKDAKNYRAKRARTQFLSLSFSPSPLLPSPVARQGNHGRINSIDLLLRLQKLEESIAT